MNDDELARWSTEQGRRFQRWLDGGKLTDPADDVDVVPAEVYFRPAAEISSAPTRTSGNPCSCSSCTAARAAASARTSTSTTSTTRTTPATRQVPLVDTARDHDDEDQEGPA